MARARNIKPGFFINEELVSLPFSTRLLFIGLWTIADREGRLEDRPMKIKMAVFPADDVDVEAGLQELAAKGLIIRYLAEGKKCIEMPNFAKHQKPHVNEVASVLPKYQALAPMVEGLGSESLLPLTESLTTDSLLVCVPDPNEAENKFVAEVVEGIKTRQNLNFIRDEAGWSETAIFARTNHFPVTSVLECYDLLRKQKWRKGPVTPKVVSDNITNLENLRTEIKEQDNASSTKPNTGKRHSTESTDDFLASINANPL